MLDLKEMGMSETVVHLLAATLRQQMPPAATAKALHVLASSEPKEPTRRQVQRLAGALNQAADLFSYGLPTVAYLGANPPVQSPT